MKTLVSVWLIVMMKELKDFFRDPRSLALSLVLPLVLFPLLFWVLAGQGEAAVDAASVYRIGLEQGIERPSWLFEDAPVILTRLEKKYPFQWRDRFHGLIIAHPDTGLPVLLYDNSDGYSSSLYAYVAERSRVKETGAVDAVQGGPPVSDIGFPLFEPERASGAVFLALVLPFMFCVFAVTCPLPVSADISAGEKERNSLEPLLSTAAPRSGIALGKMSAAFIAGLCSVCAYLTGIFVSSLLIPGILGDQAMRFVLSAADIAQLALLLAAVTGVFSGLEILAGFMTRSVREAQLLSMPLLMLGMAAVYTGQGISLVNTPGIYAHIPLVNTVVAVRSIVAGRADSFTLTGVILWNMGYLLFLFAGIVWILKKEQYPFSVKAVKTVLARSLFSRYSKSKR